MLCMAVTVAWIGLVSNSGCAGLRRCSELNEPQSTLSETVDEIVRLGGLIAAGHVYEPDVAQVDNSDPMLRDRAALLARDVLQRSRATNPSELGVADTHRLISQARGVCAAGEVLVAAELLVPCWLIQPGREALQASATVSLPSENHVTSGHSVASR